MCVCVCVCVMFCISRYIPMNSCYLGDTLSTGHSQVRSAKYRVGYHMTFCCSIHK